MLGRCSAHRILAQYYSQAENFQRVSPWTSVFLGYNCSQKQQICHGKQTCIWVALKSLRKTCRRCISTTGDRSRVNLAVHLVHFHHPVHQSFICLPVCFPAGAAEGYQADVQDLRTFIRYCLLGTYVQRSLWLPLGM